MKIIILASRFPYPLERGDKLRLYQQIKEISKKHEVVLFATHDLEIKKEWYDEVKKYCTEIYTHKFNFFYKLVGGFNALMHNWPMQSGLVYSKNFQQKIEAYCRENYDATVYCQLIRMAPYCNNLINKKVLDYMDAFGLSMEKRGNISNALMSWLYKIESNRVKDYEQKLSKKFDQLAVITHNDLKFLNLDSTLKVKVVPNSIDLNFFSKTNSIEAEYDIGFVGNLGYLPNIAAVEFIVKKIAPLYKSNYNYNLNILIAGARPPARIYKLENENVKVLSNLDDIRIAYSSIKILCAPIKSGTGQQNKILEAMAMEVPVITTKDVNDGILATMNEEILIAENETEYVTQINKLLIDYLLFENIRSNGLCFVKSNYNESRVLELFD